MVICEVRGKAVVTGLSNARIPWPVGKRPGGRARFLIVYAGLADAVRTESASAVCHWWGVTAQTVSKWRKVMRVRPMTAGTTRLKSASAKESPGIAAALKLARAKNQDPNRRRKIADAKRGKSRPEHVVEAMRKCRAGKPQSDEARAKMRAAQAGRVRPPKKEWDRDQDALLGEVPDAEVARRTGRSEKAVASRRKKRGVEPFDT